MPAAIGRAALHFDRLLSNVAVEAWNSSDGQFIADQVLPSVSVDKQSDYYAIIEKDGFFREWDAERAPMTAANKIQWSVSSAMFLARNYALAGETALEDLSNADDQFSVRENTVKAVVLGLKRAREIRVAGLVTSGTNVGSYVALSGATKWSAVDSADILGQVNSAHAFIRSQTGLVPNVAVIDWDTLQVARRSSRLLELFKYTQGGELPVDMFMRNVLKVEKMHVGQGVKNVAAQGKSASMSNIWGNNCLLAYVAPSMAGKQTQTFGLTFEWTPPIYPANMGVQRSVYNGAGENKVEVIETGHYQAHQVIARELSYLISATI